MTVLTCLLTNAAESTCSSATLSVHASLQANTVNNTHTHTQKDATRCSRKKATPKKTSAIFSAATQISLYVQKDATGCSNKAIPKYAIFSAAAYYFFHTQKHATGNSKRKRYPKIICHFLGSLLDSLHIQKGVTGCSK